MPERQDPPARTDEETLDLLGGANFGPESVLDLPSGARLDAESAQAATAAFLPDAPDLDEDELDRRTASSEDRPKLRGVPLRVPAPRPPGRE